MLPLSDVPAFRSATTARSLIYPAALFERTLLLQGLAFRPG
jgi:hypothetical protein